MNPQLTNAQRNTLKAAVLADPVLGLLDFQGTADNDQAAADWLNVVGTFVAWRTYVTQDEIMQNGFDWVRVDNLSVGRARIWEWLFDNAARAINPSKANVRSGIAECWKGTAADLAVQAAVLGHCRRNTTRAEALLATGTGTTQDPGLMSAQGSVSVQEAGTIMRG